MFFQMSSILHSLRCNELVAKCSIKAWADRDLAQLQRERLSSLHLQAAAESGVILYATTAVVVSTLRIWKTMSVVICAVMLFILLSEFSGGLHGQANTA